MAIDDRWWPNDMLPKPEIQRFHATLRTLQPYRPNGVSYLDPTLIPPWSHLDGRVFQRQLGPVHIWPMGRMLHDALTVGHGVKKKTADNFTALYTLFTKNLKFDDLMTCTISCFFWDSLWFSLIAKPSCVILIVKGYPYIASSTSI